MQPPHYSVEQTLGLAPTVSLSIQTHPYSGYFDEKFVDSFVKQQEDLKPSYIATSALELLISLLVTSIKGL